MRQRLANATHAPPKQLNGAVAAESIFDSKSNLRGEEIVELAQLIADEHSLHNIHQLRQLDPEIHDAVVRNCLTDRVRFKCEEPGETSAVFVAIMRDCFRIGTANPFIGNHWGYIPKLRRASHSMQNGSLKHFSKSWETLQRAGVITIHDNDTMASLEFPLPTKDREVSKALHEAISLQVGVSRFWQAKLEGLLKHFQ